MRFSYDDLELALLRRGVLARAGEAERCGRCHRTPLIGERVYVYDHDLVRCELCRIAEHRAPAASRLMHGPEFGHTIRVTDRRAA